MGAVLAGALISGSIYALVSIGFSLAFRVSSVFNLSHGMLVIVAGYLNYWLHAQQGLSVWASIPVSLAAVGSLGFIVESRLIPLARSVGLKPVDLLVLSWLLLLVVQDVVGIAFENQSIYSGGSEVREGYRVLGGHITDTQLLIVFTSIGVGILLLAFVSSSSVGRGILAVGDDPRLAKICGLNVERIVGVNSALAALLTSGAGIMLSYQQELDPSQGFRISVIAVISTLIGTPLGPGGAVLGAYLVALLETSVLYFVDPRLRDAAVYAFLFVVLAVVYRQRSVPQLG